MECYVIEAILNGEQRVREEDYLRRQLERDGDAARLRMRCWQALVAWLGDKREIVRATAGQGVITHGA